MTDALSDTTSDLHADKYNDPRAKITRRGIWIGVAVVAVGMLGAAGSIYVRKTKLQKTTEFWGVDTITGLQLAERIELLPLGAETFRTVELTATPGLGHLRHALLDERSFDWETVETASVESSCGEQATADVDEPLFKLKAPSCVQLRLTDPTANRIETIQLDLNLQSGWVGPSDGSKRVQLTEWVQPKLRNYIATVVNVEEKRYDLRD
ncbi:hypothetical protein Pla22_51490 [Rubripirellula amarantea]|uniref:Uncharacterized protein n=1 Tax=Rubripirellula amarantea TaxID=2527999 RepID=A0A5C5WBB0_9BACT|nr:hypothetical protein [Rubripirellula amarantea]TWT48148.1 hypothetical protein Pla22_51490 [Rubripirellula amarantea]